ncbi:unnamed protein product [Amoebophrya sp. A120]|nr:unnamed protein product [Amoebophrya sp. A120]|eukprot:GSA120T00006597001.1
MLLLNFLVAKEPRKLAPTSFVPTLTSKRSRRSTRPVTANRKNVFHLRPGGKVT